LAGLKALRQNYEKNIAEKQEISSPFAGNRGKKRNILIQK
jgi:hypothetical protein